MSSTPTDLLACAEAIAVKAACEANYRSAISRAYYAGYHAAYGFHDSLPVPGSANGVNGSHEILVQQLYHPGVKNSAPEYLKSLALAKLLNQAKVLRTHSDYKLSAEITAAQMGIALSASKNLVLNA